MNMSVDIESYDKLTSLILSSALDPSQWGLFLKELSRVSGGVHTQMFGYDLVTGMHLDLIHHLYREDFISSYKAHYADLNVWAPMFSLAEPGVSIASEAMFPTDELVKTEFYNDWVRPQEDILGGGGAVLHRDAQRVFMIGGNIRAKDREKLEQPWLDLLQLLMPHLKHAFDVNRALGGMTIERVAQQQASDQKNIACLVLDVTGKILFGSFAANQILERGNLAVISASGALKFVHSKHQDWFDDLLASAGQKKADFSASSYLKNTGDTRSYQCRIGPFDPRNFDYFPLDLGANAEAPRVLLTLTPFSADREVEKVLLDDYTLTHSEAEVVLNLCKGLDLRQIASGRSVSVNTVRNQLSSIMSKTDQHKQSELVQLIEQIRRQPVAIG